MKHFCLVLMALLISNFAFANARDWSNLGRVLAEEAVLQESPFGLYASLKDHLKTPSGHHSNYLSGIGGFNERGDFVSTRYEVVSEKWEMKNEQWHVDQWMFVLNTEMESTWALHRTMIQTVSGVLVEMENQVETEENIQRALESYLDFWEKKISK